VSDDARSEYRVREARSEDLASLPGVEHAASQLFRSTAYPEIADERPTTVEEFARWLDAGALLVATNASDAPVGFAIVFALDGDAYIHELDVHPEHGRRGVGRRLIEHVRSRAARDGHARVSLSTFSDVPWNGPYYRRLGFHEVPEERLGAGMHEVRRREAEAGLDVARRIFLSLPVEQRVSECGPDEAEP
jgi:GNAT superfamily N-acetyltransferase